MDFKYKKSGLIFNMHSYWTKQPVDAIKFFIEKYSKPKDIILDPFAGTGMTGIAGILSNRRVIINDISPISLHIAKGYCTNFKTEEKPEDILQEKENILKNLNENYLTRCPKCKNLVTIRFSIVGEVWQNEDKRSEENRGEVMLQNKKNNKFKNNYIFKEFRLMKICYTCSCSKSKLYKLPDKKDIIKWNNQGFKKYFFPTDSFFGQEPRRNYKKGITKVYQLYSSRNLTTLATIFNRINKIKDKDIKQLFLFTFTSILFNSSLMSRYRNYENTSIKMGTFYIPPLIKDTNVISNFKNKLDIIVKGNQEIFRNKYRRNIRFLKENADKLTSIKNNSIDYIYTDPPYSDIINYSELNIVYESWLKTKTKTKDEMIVNHYYNKNIEYYSSRFENFLKKSHKVLKQNGHLTLVFHHPNINHWIFIQKAMINCGLKPIISFKPIRLISNSKTSSQHKTGKNSQCFLVFNFKKESKAEKIKLKKLNTEKYLKLIKKIKKQALRLGYTNKSDLFDFLINKLIFEYEIKNNNLLS